jgi:catechol 2,3-dioxygenase-like lactoylglutathione lyase family enzyme
MIATWVESFVTTWTRTNRMSIALHHTIVPARDSVASARYFADLLGLEYVGPIGQFAAVRINETLTFDFDDRPPGFEEHHYAFLMSDEEFDAILGRVQQAGIPYGSSPGALDDRKVGEWSGKRGAYFRDLDGHLLEIRTLA